MATVKVNQNGSFSAIQSSLYLLWEFFKTTFFDLFPSVKISVEAINTIKEIGKVLKSAHQENTKIEQQIAERCEQSFRHDLRYLSDGTIMQGSILPERVTKQFVDQTV